MTALTRTVCRETAVKTVGLCHEVGGFCMDLAIAFGKPHTAVRPAWSGSTTSPSSPSSTSTARTASTCWPSMVDELGGLEALAPGPGQPEAEPFSKLDFGRRHLLKLTLLDRWGALPGANDRHLAEFMPSVLTEESGWGATWGIELTPMARREEHQDEYIAEVDAVLAGKEELRRGTRASSWPRSSTRWSPGPAASSPSTAPTPASAPTSRPTPWWSRYASSTATASGAGTWPAPRRPSPSSCAVTSLSRR